MAEYTPEEKVQNVKWAQEVTLKSLVSQGAKSKQLLGIIAQGINKKDQYNELIKTLSNLTDTIDDENTQGRASLDESKNLQASNKGLRDGMLNTANTIGRLASMDSSGLFGSIGNSFENLAGSLAKTNPGLAALASVAATVTEVFNMVWQRGTLAANGVLDMYDAGIVFTGGISQFMHGMSDTGLTLQQFGKMLTKNGQVVATMGIAKTMQLSKSFTELTQNGSNLGMNFEQAQEVLMSYSEQQRLSGRLSKMSNDELLYGAEKYGRELNRLSQVTGKRRDQIDAEIQQNRKKPSIQVLLSTLNEQAKKTAPVGFDHLQVMGNEMASAMQELIVAYKTNGLAAMLQTDPVMTEMLKQSHALNAFYSLANNAVAGNTDAMDASITSLGKLTQSYATASSEYVKIGGPVQDLVITAQSMATAAQGIAQNLNKTGDALPSPKDAQKIADAQKALDKSLLALNNQFTIFSATVLGPLIDAATYTINSLIKLGENLHNALHFLGLVGSNTDANGKPTAGPKMTGGEIATATVVGGVITALSVGLMVKLVKTVFTTIGSMGSGLMNLFKGPAVLKSLFSGGGLKSLFSGLFGGAKAAGGAEASGAGAGGAGISNMTANLKKTLTNLGGVIKDLLTGISGTIKTVALDMAAVIGKMGKALGTAIGGLGQGLGKAIQGLATGVGKGLGAGIGALFQGLATGVKAFGDTQVIKGAVALGLVAGDLYIAGKAFQEFGKVDWESMGKAGTAMLAIGGTAKIIGSSATQVIKGGVALGAAIGAIGLGMMAGGEGLKKFNDINWESMGKAGVAITALGVASAVAGADAFMILAGGLALGAAIGAIGLAMNVAGDGIKKFNDIKWESMGKAGVAMLAIGGIAAVAGLAAPLILAGGLALGAAMGAIGLAMNLVGDGLVKFEKISWESMGKAGAAIVGLGVASAIAGLAAPLIIAGGIAIGLAIAAIGAGIAGAAYLIGNTLPTLAAGMQQFADLDGARLKQAGDGMASIGVGLLAMAGGKVADSLGSLAAGIINFFTGNDPIAQLRRFEELGEPLGNAGDAMKKFAEGYTASISALNTVKFDASMLDGLEKLKDFFAGGSVFASIGAAFEQLLGIETPIDQLMKLSDIAQPLGIAGIAMTKFTKGYKAAISAINTIKLNPAMLKGLASLKEFFADDSAFASMNKVFSTLLDIDTPIDQLMKLSEIADPLNKASNAIAGFADKYTNSISKINSIKFDTSVTTGLDTLTEFFEGDGLFAAIGKVFNELLGIETPLDQLKSLGEIAEPLNTASDALSKISLAFPKGIDTFNTNILSDNAISSLDKLKSMFEGDGVFASMGKWFAGENDIIARLGSLGDSTASLPAFSSRITGFADAYTYLVQAFNEPISTEALANLVGLTDLINQQAALNSPGLLGSIFGSTPAETIAPAAPNAAIEAAKATVAATPVDKKHKDMMEILTKINDNMNSLLTVEDRQTRVMNDGFSRISGVVH